MKIRIRLSFKVLGLVLSTVSLVIFLAASIINRQFKESIIATESKRDAALLGNIATSVSNIVSCEYQELLTLKSAIESSIDEGYDNNVDTYKNMLRSICGSNRMLASAWLSFDHSFIPSSVNDGRNCIMAENTSLGTNLNIVDYDYDFESPTGPFYDVRESGKPILSEPDFFLQDGSTAKRYVKVSVAVPIENESGFVGAIGTDLNINVLCHFLDTTLFIGDQNIIILSRKNMTIGYPNPDLVGLQFEEIDSVLNNAIASNDGHFVLKDKSGADSLYCTSITTVPAALGNGWRLITTHTCDEIDAQIGSSLKFVTRVIIFGLLILAIIVFILSVRIATPIKNVSAIINKLSLGQVNDALKMDIESNDELGQMADSSNKVVDGLLQVTKYAENIGNGNSDYKFSPLSDKDVLGNAIIEMKNSLDRAKEEEKQRKIEEGQLNWASNGINLFNKVLRVDNDNIKVLAEDIIEHLILYLDAQMGAFYIVPNDRNGAELVAAIGFDSAKLNENQFVAAGNGLIGRAYLEKETIFISDIPSNTDKIGSGLGKALPKSVLVVPLIYNKSLAGIIELYSFKIMQPYQISFVEKLAENIASTISTVEINGQTARLLEKSKHQAEVLEQQEEEIRQNMEEMQATQEESSQKEAELTSIIDAYHNTVAVAHFDTNQRITNVNDEYLKLMKVKRNNVIGKRHKGGLIMNEKEQAEHNRLWEELLSGKIVETDEMLNDDKKEVWVHERMIPIKDSSDAVIEVLAVFTNITEEKKIEKQIRMIQDGIIPEEIKNQMNNKAESDANQKLVDLAHLNMVYKNDADKIETILKRYTEQIPTQIDDMAGFIKKRNYKVLKVESKSLMTKANYLGLKQMYNSLDTIIKLIDEDKNLTSIPKIFDSIKSDWETASAEINEILKKEA
ncbi:MAG: GAF domain-containing protein [Salinivirgaceae bacterium]|nr:GAF domain-containing protein [Salinivirgaceae bacterium]